MGDAPDTRRSLAVVPLIGNQRYYGESPASLRRDPREGGVRAERNSLAAGQEENTRFCGSLVGAAAETHLNPKNRSSAPAFVGP
jgi:hypothetical protein